MDGRNLVFNVFGGPCVLCIVSVSLIQVICFPIYIVKVLQPCSTMDRFLEKLYKLKGNFKYSGRIISINQI